MGTSANGKLVWPINIWENAPPFIYRENDNQNIINRTPNQSHTHLETEHNKHW